jgi:hypothetical protein
MIQHISQCIPELCLLVCPAASRSLTLAIPLLAAELRWQTVDMEHGRSVMLTLHQCPVPTSPEHPLGVALVTVADQPQAGGQQGEERVRVRVLLSPSVVLGPALPLARSSGSGEVLSGRQLTLAGGVSVLEPSSSPLTIGDPADAEQLAVPGGLGFLVASSLCGSVTPGYCRVALPEQKQKPQAAVRR